MTRHAARLDARPALLVTLVLTAVAACSSAAKAAPAGSPRLPTAATSAPLLRTTAPPWDRPADQQATVALAGLSLKPAEDLQVHYHAHLDVVVDGSPQVVPAGLGINQDPQGIAALHTHDTTGILHVEAPALKTFTLTQVFDEWAVAFGNGRLGSFTTGTDGQVVDVYVNGTKVPDAAAVTLTPHEEIAVIVSHTGDSVSPPASYAFPAGD